MRSHNAMALCHDQQRAYRREILFECVFWLSDRNKKKPLEKKHDFFVWSKSCHTYVMYALWTLLSFFILVSRPTFVVFSRLQLVINESNLNKQHIIRWLSFVWGLPSGRKLRKSMLSEKKMMSSGTVGCWSLVVGVCPGWWNNLSNERNPGWLGYIGDYTTQLYRDYNKPL